MSYQDNLPTNRSKCVASQTVASLAMLWMDCQQI